MTNKLWEASLKEKKNSNLYAFEKFISKKIKKKFNLNYKTFLNWTIKNSPEFWNCLLYTSPSPRDISGSRMPSSA